MKTRIPVGAAGLVALLLPGAATADERRASFRVAATVVAGCTVTSDAGGSWGRIDLGAVPGLPGQRASGGLIGGGVNGIVLACTPETSASLTADAGENAVAGQRRLRRPAGGPGLAYELRVGDTGTSWTTQSIPVAFPRDSSRRVLPVSAAVALAGPVAAGDYVDTVRITLTF